MEIALGGDGDADRWVWAFCASHASLLILSRLLRVVLLCTRPAVLLASWPSMLVYFSFFPMVFQFPKVFLVLCVFGLAAVSMSPFG
jgi:hypothetical protein